MILTRAQRVALKRKWDQDANGFSYRAFRKSVVRFDYGAVGVYWCRMWLGIETDGYTHS